MKVNSKTTKVKDKRLKILSVIEVNSKTTKVKDKRCMILFVLEVNSKTAKVKLRINNVKYYLL